MNTTTTGNRPRLSFYHANGKCTGCAAYFELYPAHDCEDGSIRLRLAGQKAPLNTDNMLVFPSFDWERGISVRLTFDDLCRMLQVFRGEVESLADGKGIFHHSRRAFTALRLCHVVEPCSCFKLEAHERVNDSQNETTLAIFLTPSEALGLQLAIESSMGLIAFGVPNA